MSVFQRLQHGKVSAKFSGAANKLTETLRGGSISGLVNSGNGIFRRAAQNVVDLESLHVELIEPTAPMSTTPFNGVTVSQFTIRPDGPIEDLSIRLRLSAANGKGPIGIHVPTTFFVDQYFWRFGESTFEEPPISNYIDQLYLTNETEYAARNQSWCLGNFFEREEIREYHPSYISVSDSGANADIDVYIPLNSFWVNKEFDLQANQQPAFILQVRWADISAISNTTSTVTDLVVDPAYTHLVVRTKRPTVARTLAIQNVYQRSIVQTRCILPQHVEVPPVTYVVDGKMKFNIGANLQGLLTGIIFGLRPTSNLGTPANEVWTVIDAASAGASTTLHLSGLGFTKPLAYNANEATTQAAINEIRPGFISEDNIDVGTGYLSDGSSTISFVGGMGGMPHASEGRAICVTGAPDWAGTTTATYALTTPGVRKIHPFMTAPIDTMTMYVQGQTGVISSQALSAQTLGEFTMEGILNPDAFKPNDDNAWYLLPFCPKFGESYATGRLHGVMPVQNTNVQLEIKTLPANKLPTRFTYSGDWALTVIAYKLVEFVSKPTGRGLCSVKLDFAHPIVSF